MKKLTRNQRIAVGVLTFSSAALLADKTVLSPQTANAQASVAPDNLGMTEDAAKSSVSPESMAANLRVVSRWIDEKQAEGPQADPFAWHLAPRDHAVESDLLSFEAASASWSLTAIMGTDGYRIAVINGKPIRINEFVEFLDEDDRRAKVVEIREDTVVLYHDTQTVSIELPVSKLSVVDRGGL